MSLKTDIDQLVADAAIVHGWAHGDENHSETMGGVAVRSPAKLIADLDASEAAAEAAAGVATTQAGIATAKADLTAADVVLTHADVVLTHADVVLTHADAVTTTTKASEALASQNLAHQYALDAASVVQQDLSAIDRTVHTGASIVDAVIYDTAKDSDDGLWRKRCQHTSWYQETIYGVALGELANETAARAVSGATTNDYYHNTTDGKFYALNAGSGQTEVFRGNVREFPARALLVVETERVIIYDLTQPGAPMWMVFYHASSYTIVPAGPITGVATVNGTIVFSSGSGGALRELIFSADATGVYYIASYYPYGNIKDRNIDTESAPRTHAGIVSADCNSVALTVLDDAPIDAATGLPVPTIDVFTSGGTSRINHDGTVADLVDTAGDDHNAGCILASGDSVALNSTNGNVDIYTLSNTLANTLTPDRTYDQATTPALLEAVDAGDKVIAMRHRLAIGQDNGVNVLIENPTSVAAGMVAYITNAYNSGWMVGDIRGAWLADTVAGAVGATDPDRSVKNNPLTLNGALTKSAVASGAQLMAYSGFSVANYLEQPYNADLDFGTGDFCVMGWLKEAANSAIECILERDSVSTAQRFTLEITAAGYLAFTADDNTTTRTATGSAAVDDAVWRHVICTYSAGTLTIYVNGVVYATATGAALLTLNNASAVLRVGYAAAGANPLTNGSLALWRTAAMAPSADQIKHIYETEKALFAANAKCCIDGTSTAVTALAYDEDTDLLHVGTSWGRSAFHGLARVASEATPVGVMVALSASNGAVAQAGSTAADVYVPAYLLREELARGQDQESAFGSALVAHEFDATTGQVAFVLPLGWRAKFIYSAGALKREGSTKDYTVSFDGFRWTVTFAAAPGNGVWVSVLAAREA